MTAIPVTPGSAYTDALRNLNIVFFIDSVPFTRDVIEGRTSLGGSESAGIGIAKALAARGHDVHIFATKLELKDDDPTVYADVSWHPAEHMADTLRVVPPDVFISLRMSAPFALTIQSGLNLLWNQDMLTDVSQVGAALTQIDGLVYVSHYHRQQWEGRAPEVLGQMPAWVTKNPFDPTLIPVWPEHVKLAAGEGSADLDYYADLVQRNPYKFCFISRPERGLAVLLHLWPKIKAKIPEAELHLCRYDSMYDAKGWGQVCAAYDAEVEKVNQAVGGITWHGQLSKPSLYTLLTSCSLMLYPGVHDFAETSCIAAIEAQACGCVFVGSHRGALPETLAEGAGVLIEGDASTDAYQDSFVEAVYTLSHPVEGPPLRESMQKAGQAHVFPAYTFEAVAADWEGYIVARLTHRYETEKVKVLRQLLHYDHHVAAKLVAEDLQATTCGATDLDTLEEAQQAIARCARVISQEDQTAEHYAQFAMNTELEAQTSSRLQAVVKRLEETGATRLLDVACGNGSLALLALKTIPDLTVVGLDYAGGNIQQAREAIERAGFADRATFIEVDLHDRPGWKRGLDNGMPDDFDAVFCGEYLEHTAEPHLVVDWLESFAEPGGHILLTVPHGPFTELLDFRTPVHRGHTHHFQMRDLAVLLQRKPSFACEHLGMGDTPRGNPVGHWIVEWQRHATAVCPAEPLNHWRTVLLTRPYQRLVGAILTKDSEEWLFKCLASIWPIVDDILILDTGSTDKTCDIAFQFPNVHWWDARDLDIVWPLAGFAAARNALLDRAEQAFDADWLLWIDADEHLAGGHRLRRHLQPCSPYHGYVTRQHHLMLDFEKFFDIPCRVIRTGRGVRFYGLVHEQPESKPDLGVFPALDMPEVNIVHYGYETEDHRRHKLLTRNFPLLKREMVSTDPPPRTMAYVLFMRDLVTLSGYQGADKKLNAESTTYLRSVLALYTKHGFDDPGHRLHHLAFPSYQLALKWLGLGIEVIWSFAAGNPRLNGRPKPERFLAKDGAEADRLCSFKTRAWLKRLEPVTYDCSPWVNARTADVPAPELPQKVESIRRAGKTRIVGRPLDENGGIELTQERI